MARNATPSVSVLTPVYNGEKFLRECIESVRAQSFDDWEYIIVDNCSEDNSVSIAETYAASDPRIRVVRCEEFVTVQRNFNRCLQYMHGGAKYCKYLAADDWLFPECLERMVLVAERFPNVGIVSSYTLEGGRVGQDGVVPYPHETMPGKAVVRAALANGEFATGSPTQLLYRADLIRRVVPFFVESIWHMDVHAAFRTLLDCDFGFVHQVLTATRVHAGAITSSSQRINTYIPNEIRMRIQFGRTVMDESEYRAGMRSWLYGYASFLLKQYLKPSRFNDAQFLAYHRREIDCMLDELHEDRESSLALRALRHLTRKPRLVANPASKASASAGEYR